MQVSVPVEKGWHEAISQLIKLCIVLRRMEQQHLCWCLALALPALVDWVCRQERIGVDNAVNLQIWLLKDESWHILKRRKKVAAWKDSSVTNMRVRICAARTVFMVDFSWMNYIGLMILNARSFESRGFIQELEWVQYNYEWSVTNKTKWRSTSDQKQARVLIQNIGWVATTFDTHMQSPGGAQLTSEFSTRLATFEQPQWLLSKVN